MPSHRKLQPQREPNYVVGMLQLTGIVAAFCTIAWNIVG